MAELVLPSTRLCKKEYLAALRAMPCVEFVDDEGDTGDGLWVWLRDGWHWEMPGQHVIHEDTLAELKRAIHLVSSDAP